MVTPPEEITFYYPLLSFLENGIAPIIAKRVLEVSTYSQIIVGGSNLGELLGAFTVFVLANRVHT